MNKTNIIRLILISMLTACTSHNAFEKSLSTADSLMREQPDSAYRLLYAMEPKAASMPQALQMRRLLLLSNAQNKVYKPFTSDSIGILLTEYYSRNGNANERMLAHYIKGCAYRDLGDQPAALNCYNLAIGAADTSLADCDFRQLCIIHAQIAGIFRKRGLPDEALLAYEKAEQYALKNKDTLSLLNIAANKSNVMLNKGLIDEALTIKEKVAALYLEKGYPQKAAQSKVQLIKWYARRGDFPKAKAAMDDYEAHSGHFTADGHVKTGKEDYYHIKGTYYYEKRQMDSAQYFFQKLQTKGKTVNDRYLASWGLSQLYKKLEISDSIAKYAFLNSIQNDSIYNEQNAQNLQHAQAQYDYTRHLETAHRKELEAKETQLMLYKWIAGSLIAIGIFGILILFQRKQNRRNKQAIEGLNILIEEKKGLIHSLNRQLEQQAIDIEDYRQKVETIQVLNQKIAVYETGMINRVNANLINQLNKESAIQTIIHRLNSKDKNIEKQPTHDEWNAVYSVAEKYFPALCDIKANPKISPLEYQICLLTKLRFEIADIVLLTGKDNSFITAKRKRMLPKLFNCTGSAKDFDALILDL